MLGETSMASTPWALYLGGCMACCCLLNCICNVIKRITQGPFQDYGGRVVSIHDTSDWDALLTKAATCGQLVLVDCYATWCPPCRTA